MAFVDARVLRSLQVSESTNEKGAVQMTASEEYLIISNTRNPLFSDVLADATLYANLGAKALPQLGDSMVLNGVTLYVTTRDLAYYKDNERAVVMTVRYSAKTEPSNPPPPPDDVDPTTWQRITVTTQQITKPAEGWKTFNDINKKIPLRGFGGQVIDGFEQPAFQPKPAQNSAGDPVDGLEEELALVRLTYTNTQVIFPNFERLLFYTNRCNADLFLGCRPYTVRVTGWSAEYDQRNNVWSVSLEFLYNSEGWTISYFDVGFNEAIDGKRKAIVDLAGNPVSKPVPLDGKGKAQAIVTGTEAAEVEPIVLTLYPYPAEDFANTIFRDCNI